MELTHSDSRRNLYSFPEAKVIKANKDTVIGQHFHKKKTEYFVLSSGTCKMHVILDGILRIFDMEYGIMEEVLPGTYHEFHLTKDSILIGLNSRAYDATDDYRLPEASERPK